MASALVLMGLALAVGTAIWEGYVLHVLWGWFAYPIFGYGPISVAQGIGIAAVVGMLTHQAPAEEEDRFAKVLVWAIVSPLCALVVGWFCK